jgi:hypothetical protein
MKNSIKTELSNHILDRINDGILTTENRDEWHFLCFNEDYYIIGYFQASEWLKKHNIEEFEACGICQEYEIENFGESQIYDNSEKTVNMLAYIYGEEILNSFNVDTLEELEEEVNELV